MRFRFFICALLMAAAIACAPADARPLSREDCDALSKELDAMGESDVPKAVMNGPEWTLAHMPEAMEQVKRYLRVEEDLRFRCAGRKVPDLEAEVAGKPAEAKDKKAKTKASLEAEMSAALSSADKNQGGDVPDAVPVRTKPPAPRTAQRAPAAAAAAPAPAKGLDAANRILFPMGR